MFELNKEFLLKYEVDMNAEKATMTLLWLLKKLIPTININLPIFNLRNTEGFVEKHVVYNTDSNKTQNGPEDEEDTEDIDDTEWLFSKWYS